MMRPYVYNTKLVQPINMYLNTATLYILLNVTTYELSVAKIFSIGYVR